MILVTGGSGFVGGHVVHALREQDRPVRCLVRDVRKAEKLRNWGCELVEGDVTDPTSLHRAVDSVDVVVHLVAIRQGKPQQFQRIMVSGTRDLLKLAKEGGAKRFVFMSALGTSEETKDVVPYFGAKWQMEQDVQESGFPYVIFRPSFIFGRDGGILPTFRRLAKIAPVTPIIGSGKQRIQPIWVDDVAAYFAKAIDHEPATNRIFELGGPDVVTWNEFWVRLKRALGRSPPERAHADGVHAGQRAADGAPPGQHPAHARPAEDARGRRQRRHERRRGADLRAAADATRRAATPRGLEIEKGVGFSQPPDPDTNVGVVEALCRPDPEKLGRRVALVPYAG